MTAPETPSPEAPTPEHMRWTPWLRLAFAALAAAVLAVAFRPWQHVPLHPISEDAYYSLAVARNIAQGRGITIDGSTWTNGFQPLFTLLCVPIYWITDDPIRGVRLVHLLQGAIMVASALLFGRLASRNAPARDEEARRDLAWLASLSWLGSLQLLQHSLNGLETPLVLLLVLACWWIVQGTEAWTPRRAALLGLAAGLLVLARIDGAFLAALLGGALLLKGGGSWRDRLKLFAIVGCVSALVAAPWFAYNVWLHGSLMPSSGRQSIALLLNLRVFDWKLPMMAVAYAAMNLLPTATLGDLEWQWAQPPGPLVLVPAAARLVVLAALAWVGWRAASKRPAPARGDRLFLTCLALHLAVLLVYYGFNSLAWWFYERYLVVAAPLGLFVLARALGAAMGRVRETIPAAALVFVVVGGAVVHSYWTTAGYHGFFYVYTFWREQVALVEERVPPGARVGARQSGTLGYFRENVVNLDGKVNEEALSRQADLMAYAEEQGIEWVCEWPGMAPWAFQPGDGLPWWEKVEQRGHFGLWRRTDVPFEWDAERRAEIQQQFAE